MESNLDKEEIFVLQMLYKKLKKMQKKDKNDKDKKGTNENYISYKYDISDLIKEIN